MNKTEHLQPVKLYTKKIFYKKQPIHVSICHAYTFYDVIVESQNHILLDEIKKFFDPETKVNIRGVFGRPLLFIDTFSDLSDAKEFFYQFEDILLEKNGEGIKNA